MPRSVPWPNPDTDPPAGFERLAWGMAAADAPDVAGVELEFELDRLVLVRIRAMVRPGEGFVASDEGAWTREADGTRTTIDALDGVVLMTELED